jgi:hypothetical protein
MLRPTRFVIASMLLLTTTSFGADKWYRGNTHTHTVLCGHADSTPEAVTRWYHDRGYNFLVLSEHNEFIDPKSVKMPPERREEFILVPGQEITGHHVIHTTAINTKELVPWELFDKSKTAVIQTHVDGAAKAGGHAILNHPNFRYAVTARDMAPVRGLHMFELYNGHPSVHNHGDTKHPSTEKIWDELLTGGMLIYGVSSDDAHHFQKIAPNLSNPGRGWIMVRADKLDGDTITAAIRGGKFYSSNGVFLSRCDRSDKSYDVEVDLEKTEKLLKGDPLLRGKAVAEGTEGLQIEFIGPEGRIIESFKDAKASFPIAESAAYVRVEITLTRKHPKTGLEAYFA